MKSIYQAEFPIETKSEANLREHWSKKAKRAKQQRAESNVWCRIKFGLLQVPPTAKIVVQLKRLATKELDSDNLATAFKAIRDGIADYLLIDDGSPRIRWTYEQQKISRYNAIEVTIGIDC